MGPINLAVAKLQQEFSKWNDAERIVSLPAIEALANISNQCVASLSGDQRILAYVLNRLLFSIVQSWEDEPIIEQPGLFLNHAHQPIAKAIAVLQNEGAGSDEITAIAHQLVNAHLRLAV